MSNQVRCFTHIMFTLFTTLFFVFFPQNYQLFFTPALTEDLNPTLIISFNEALQYFQTTDLGDLLVKTPVHLKVILIIENSKGWKAILYLLYRHKVGR